MNKDYRELKIYTDGASRGNPGDAAWGYVILDEQENPVTNQSGYIGHSTNNQAEYFAVIRALQRASELTRAKIHLYSDSQLLVNQVTGAWKVKDDELRRLHGRVRSLVDQFKEVNFTHLPRENSHIGEADGLCNDRLDEVQGD
ncbi:ribonuclease HI family protein [Candidatus Bipolaricaulota bacterium]|nr:ribonuclease HI family protein [Candidatus Bipolaricaulota bacterium]